MGQSTKLTDAMRAKYPQDTEFPATTSLEAGIIHVKNFRIAESEKFQRIAYIDAVEGHFRTTSKNVVGSLAGEVGQTIKELLGKGADSVELEIVKHKANTGRIGLAIKAF